MVHSECLCGERQVLMVLMVLMVIVLMSTTVYCRLIALLIEYVCT